MKIELKKVKFMEKMSEETNCFFAELYVNGKNIGYCKNDGRGGCTEVIPYAKHREIFVEVERYCKTLPYKIGNIIDINKKNNLENVVDNLFEEWYVNQTLKKDMKKGICYRIVENDINYKIVTWKNGRKIIPLTDMLKTKDSIEIVKRFCLQLRQDNIIILNDNLPFEI